MLEAQEGQRTKVKSQERDVIERDMLMTLHAQPGYLNAGKVRNQSQQHSVKQNYSNKLKNPTAKVESGSARKEEQQQL